MTDDFDFSLAGRSWSGVAELERLVRAELDAAWPGELLEFRLSLRGDVVVVSGQVASEQTKASATRALIAYDRVFKIQNDLEVTGFLAPAASGDDEALFATAGENDATSRSGLPGDPAAPALRPASPGAATVTRHPALDVAGEVLIGKNIKISVDLRAELPDAQVGSPIGLEADPGWQTLLVDVKIVSGQLEGVEPADGVVVVRRDGPTTPAWFTATVSAQAAVDGSVHIAVSFMHGTRLCGMAEKAVPLGKQAEAGKADSDGRGAAAGQKGFGLGQAGGPTMTVTIHSVGSGRLVWHWTTFPRLRRPGLATTGEVLVEKAQEYAAGLLAACPGYGPDQSRRRMRAIGEQIWQRAPDSFRVSYRELRAALGSSFPIQFFSAEPYVPWEMMRPSLQDVPEADHLFIDHPVARWPLSSESMLVTPLPAGRIESYVPDYIGGATLPAARREQAWLIETLGANKATPCRAGFIALMEDGSDVGMVHFAGHGKADTGRRDGGLEMEDGPVVLDDILQGGVKLGHSCRSLVVLNACEAADQQSALGFVEGWGPGLARQGFGAVIAPLWRVKDEVSADFMISALSGLVCEGRTFGESVAAARASTADASATAFAYIAYGDVMAPMAEITR